MNLVLYTCYDVHISTSVKSENCLIPCVEAVFYVGRHYVRLILIPPDDADFIGFASLCCLAELLYFSINS